MFVQGTTLKYSFTKVKKETRSCTHFCEDFSLFLTKREPIKLAVSKAFIEEFMKNNISKIIKGLFAHQAKKKEYTQTCSI